MLFKNLEDWKVDPDHRQDRGPGPVTQRKMTQDEWAKYGPVNTTLQRVGFVLYAKEPENIFAKVHTG